MKCANFLCDSHSTREVGTSANGCVFWHEDDCEKVKNCKARKTYNRIMKIAPAIKEYFHTRFINERDEYYGRNK